MKHLFIIFFIFVALQLNAQSDSSHLIKYTPNFRFQEGIFIDFEQVKANNPLQKSKIIADKDYNSKKFIEHVVSNEEIAFYDNNGIKQKIATDKIWGYSENGKLYVNWKDEFNFIPYLGQIAHFVAIIEVTENLPMGYSYYSPYTPMNYTPTTTTEMRQYLLNFETGNITDFTLSNVEALLTSDPELYNEFNELRKRKKRKLMFLYITKYNERNPLYLQKSN